MPASYDTNREPVPQVSASTDALYDRLEREKERRAKLIAMKAEAEDDLISFVRMFWPVLEPSKPLIEGWVLEAIADVLMAITDGHMKKVCINVPPGSSKSSMLNVLWPAWEWGPQNMPHLRYLSLSYSTSVPERDNIRFARVIKDPVYQRLWGDRVDVTRDGMETVENRATGWKRVTSTGGGVTGWRGDRLLMDDVDNPSNVESEAVRETTIRFVREIMPSRLNSLEDSAVINLQQRTHEDDATGTLIKTGQDYQFLCIPMEFDPLRIYPVVLRRDDDGEPSQTWVDPRSLDEHGRQLSGLVTNARGELKVEFGSPMSKAEGTLAWPDLFPPEEVIKTKARLGPYAWDSQYQQYPGVRGGGIIRRDWWNLWPDEVWPALGTVIVSVDTAVEEGPKNDWNAMTAWGAFAGDSGEPLLLMLDAWRVRCPLAELVDKVATVCKRRQADYLLIEHKTRGRDLHDEIARLYQNASWQTVLVKVEVGKVSRMKAVQGLFSGDYRKDVVTGVESWENGMIYAPDKDWAAEVMDEVSAFPYGGHDDYCFVAGTMIATRAGPTPIEALAPGDEVLTPVGWRRVVAAGFTGRAVITARVGLQGTAGHPVFELDKGYQPLYKVADRMKVGRSSLCGLIQTILLTPWSSMASLIDGWEDSADTISRSQRRMLAALVLRASMSPSGNTLPDQGFRMVMKSTIGMATLSIAILRIWSAYRKACIVAYLRGVPAAMRCWLTSHPFGRKRRSGINPTMGGLGIDNTQPRHWRKVASRGITFARTAARLLSPKTNALHSVQTPVCSSLTGVRNTLRLEISPATTAARCSPLLVLDPNTVASPVRIAPLKQGGGGASDREAVFNLSVEWPHCYYANGVLVHNCDTVSMALGWVRKNGVVLRKSEFEEAELERNRYRKPVGVPYAIGRRA